MKNKRLLFIQLGAALVLSIPLITMQFTNEVNWDALDFMVMGTLLFGTGLLCELIMRKVTSIKYRIGICLILLVALFLIWVELAVGVFGTPFAGS